VWRRYVCSPLTGCCGVSRSGRRWRRFVGQWCVVKRNTSSRTTVRYPARGPAGLWLAQQRPTTTPGLAALIGSARAAMLGQLTTPRTTGSAARKAGVTPSAASQTLGVLRNAGLVSRTRRGRESLHELTVIGRGLLVGDAA